MNIKSILSILIVIAIIPIIVISVEDLTRNDNVLVNTLAVTIHNTGSITLDYDNNVKDFLNNNFIYDDDIGNFNNINNIVIKTENYNHNYFYVDSLKYLLDETNNIILKPYGGPPTPTPIKLTLQIKDYDNSSSIQIVRFHNNNFDNLTLTNFVGHDDPMENYIIFDINFYSEKESNLSPPLITLLSLLPIIFVASILIYYSRRYK